MAKFGLESCSNLLKSKFSTSRLPKNDIFGPFEIDFTQNRRGGKIIKFQQSQALTSHFECFWIIVHCYETFLKNARVGNSFPHFEA